MAAGPMETIVSTVQRWPFVGAAAENEWRSSPGSLSTSECPSLAIHPPSGPKDRLLS